jgi:hypothetical protein
MALGLLFREWVGHETTSPPMVMVTVKRYQVRHI